MPLILFNQKGRHNMTWDVKYLLKSAVTYLKFNTDDSIVKDILKAATGSKDPTVHEEFFNKVVIEVKKL